VTNCKGCGCQFETKDKKQKFHNRKCCVYWWNKTNARQPKARLIWNARNRAVKNKLEFNLTLDNIFWPTHCPILGLQLIYVNKNKLARNSASIDRRNNKKGYTVENVQVVSSLANTMKSDANLEQLKSFADWVYSALNDDTLNSA